MLGYFILGAVCAVLGVSILESVTELLVALFEVGKAKLNVQIMKYNAQIQELTTPENKTRAIGFAIEEEDDYDEGY